MKAVAYGGRPPDQIETDTLAARRRCPELPPRNPSQRPAIPAARYLPAYGKKSVQAGFQLPVFSLRT